MAAKVTVTKAEEASIKYMLAQAEEIQKSDPLQGMLAKIEGKHIKNVQGFLAKIAEKSAAPPPTTLGYTAFYKILREALGTRLVSPPNPAPSWYAIQTNRLKSLGINDEQAKLIAVGVKNTRMQTIAIDMVMARLTSFLAQGQQAKEREANAGRETPTGFGREED